MASIVFLISTLALLATASAELCETRSIGDLDGEPIVVLDKTISYGSYNVHLKNVCSKFGPTYFVQGAELTACVDVLDPPSISFVSLTQVNIQVEGSARIVGTIYCSNLLKDHQSHRPMLGRHRHPSLSVQVHDPEGRR